MLSNRTPVNAPASRLATYQRRASVPVTIATVLIVPALLARDAERRHQSGPGESRS
jgi:hypothetical protein